MNKKLYCCLALVLASFSVSAARVQMSHFPPNPGVLPGGGWQFTPGTTFGNPPSPRMWVDGVYQSARVISATDSAVVSGRAGALAIQAVQRITLAEAALVATRCLGNPLCMGATAAAAAAMPALLDAYRLKPYEQGLGFDPGQDTVSTGNYCLADPLLGPEICSSSHLSTFNAWAPRRLKNWSNNFAQGVPGWTFELTGVAVCTPQGNCSGLSGVLKINGTVNTTQTFAAAPYLKVVQACPAVIDFSDPAYSVPGGPVMRDGKCPSGRYQPISAQDASARVFASPPPAESNKLLDAVREAINTGVESAPAELTTNGPASQVGQPVSSTTTGPNGTTTETKTPTYNYSYNDDKVTYTTTIKTETCVGAGSCSTTTTTPPQPTEQDPEDPCTAAPDRAGCAKLGTAPDAEDIKKKDISVSVTPEGGFGAADGSCPGPITLRNGSVVDPYGLVCTYMAGIRFAVIGVAWLMAALIFIGRVD